MKALAIHAGPQESYNQTLVQVDYSQDKAFLMHGMSRLPPFARPLTAPGCVGSRKEVTKPEAQLHAGRAVQTSTGGGTVWDGRVCVREVTDGTLETDKKVNE